jgi:hypothetical protein
MKPGSGAVPRNAIEGRRAIEAPKQPERRDGGRARGQDRPGVRQVQPPAKPALALPAAQKTEPAPTLERPLGRDLVEDIDDLESGEEAPSYGARKHTAKPAAAGRQQQGGRAKSEPAAKGGGGRRTSSKSAEKPAQKPATHGRRRPEAKAAPVPKQAPAAAPQEDEEFGAGIGE